MEAAAESQSNSPQAEGGKPDSSGVGTYEVRFSISGVSVRAGADELILEIAEENGVEIDSGCRAGSCFTCKVRLLSGQVDMQVDADLGDDGEERGLILACSSTPKSDVVIEA